MDEYEISRIESKINYHFRNPKLLEQAFIRKSYAEEHNKFVHNEVLEFYGDEILDMFVTLDLFDKYTYFEDDYFMSAKNEGELTEIKAKNVKKETLARCIDVMRLAQYLCLNASDFVNDVQETPSAKEDLFEAIVGAVAIDCEWNFFTIRDVCDTMLSSEKAYETYFEDLDKLCEDLDFSNPIYVEDHPKGSMKQNPNICTVYIRNLNYSRTEEGKSFEDAKEKCACHAYNDIVPLKMAEEVGTPCEEHAVDQLNRLYQKKYISEPEYEFSGGMEDGFPNWHCTCSVFEADNGPGRGYCCDTKKKAKNRAALEVLEYLLSSDYLYKQKR